MDASFYRVDRYVLDTLMRDLVGHDRRPSAFLVYLALAAAFETGRGRLSHASLAEATGLSKRAVQDAVGHLRRRGLLAATETAKTEALTYEPQHPWRR